MPNYWRAWTPGAATPQVFDDPQVLQQWLSQQAATDAIAVTEYDLIERQTIPYNITGGRPLPPAPRVNPNASPVAYQHWQRP